MLKDTLREILLTQKKVLQNRNNGLLREALVDLPELKAHALIVSGVRRCGKSTLLFQLMKDKYPDAIYVNFEDPRLYEFDTVDFSRLDEVISEMDSKVLFFDEIQIFKNWEKYIRFKLDEGYKLVITGSNASLLSKELGTKLTGRHITKELFPFSYSEFLLRKKYIPGKKSVEKYLTIGGFPEYISDHQDEMLQQLLEDIVIRDIVVRYGIRDVKILQRLAWYLISNVGKGVTANRVKSLFGVAANSTILEYFSYLENAYLIQFVPKFSYSHRKQLINPRKVYAIDPGLVQANSGSFTEDYGRKLENLVFLKLRRNWKEIYYFAEKGECDFLVFEKGKLVMAVQVCYHVDVYNQEREINGLVEALNYFSITEGTIVTLDQEDTLKIDDKLIHLVPSYQWLQNEKSMARKKYLKK
ncbi:MAG: ATP-binding protein [Sediminibacterium sp.]|nr:ATP-binding protein [Sediminibacterium sp.]